ncbi:hypothetical protein DL96DRAFT_1523052 [Flagelloscypha sp. PMI_526]|nr:hypothetical protein DL96DRAFT_1523052 [Flagelloscypha sp. PMI_526]
MPLEATMIVIDNSEYTRNGDYLPTRFDAQSDAAITVFQTKVDSNPENTVGMMSMAGKSPEVLVTHTKEVGQIHGAIHTSEGKIGGSIDLPTAISVAQLALKHRENKNLRQRIIVFVASPLDADESALIRLAKKLKKNNVAVDIIAFGDGIEEAAIPGEEHKPLLQKFVETVNSSDNSHYVAVEPSIGLLSDAVISSPILSGDRSAGIPDMGADTGAGGGPSSTNDFEFGVDPSLDPELAMALRLSMQEAQARDNVQQQAATDASASIAVGGAVETAAAATEEVDKVPANPTDEEEEAMLQQALALSTEQDIDMDDSAEGDDAMDAEEDEDEEEEDDEDAEIQKAIALSMQENQDDKPDEKK